jgi:hypothetical protein
MVEVTTMVHTTQYAHFDKKHKGGSIDVKNSHADDLMVTNTARKTFGMLLKPSVSGYTAGGVSQAAPSGVAGAFGSTQPAPKTGFAAAVSNELNFRIPGGKKDKKARLKL